MRKTYMMAKANLAKMKSQGIILTTLLVITAMLLNLGLMLALTFSGYMHDIARELNTKDTFYTLPYVFFTDDVRGRIENHEQIRSLTAYEGVMLPTRIPEMIDVEVDFTFMFRNMEITPSVSSFSQVTEILDGVPNPILIPHVFSADTFGVSLGDSLEFFVDGEPIVFTVAGFIADILTHGTMTFVYVSKPMYSELVQRFEHHHAALLFADIYGDEITLNPFMRQIFTEGITETNSRVMFYGLCRDLRIFQRGNFARTVAMITSVFSIILLVVGIITIRFSINNKIEQDFSQLGSLKAAGYTSLQIRLGLMAQYLSLAIVGCILSVPLVRLTLPIVSNVMAQQIGLFWRPSFHDTAIVAVLTLGILMLLVASFALYCSRRIKTIDPVVAIRGGASGHSFRRNYLPLSKTILPVNIAIGGKLSLQNPGQSIALLLIFIIITFTMGIGANMIHVASRQLDGMRLAQAREVADTVLELAPGADSTIIRDEIAAMPGVIHAVFFDYAFIDIGDTRQVPMFVIDDFALRTRSAIFRGRYPVHVNEVAISWTAANTWNVGIDDILHINGTPFVVTGLTQGGGAIQVAGSNRESINLTTQGARTLSPDFVQSRLHVNLFPEMAVQDFVSEVIGKFDSQIVRGENLRAIQEATLIIMMDIYIVISTVAFVVVTLIMLFVLYFITAAVIIRRYRFLGIQKAMGYTTFDLMQQMSVSFMLPLILGAVFGIVASGFSFNNIMVLTSTGAREASFDVAYLWLIGTGIALAIVSYAIILLITGRIRKISACDLVR